MQQLTNSIRLFTRLKTFFFCWDACNKVEVIAQNGLFQFHCRKQWSTINHNKVTIKISQLSRNGENSINSCMWMFVGFTKIHSKKRYHLQWESYCSRTSLFWCLRGFFACEMGFNKAELWLMSLTLASSLLLQTQPTQKWWWSLLLQPKCTSFGRQRNSPLFWRLMCCGDSKNGRSCSYQPFRSQIIVIL